MRLSCMCVMLAAATAAVGAETNWQVNARSPASTHPGGANLAIERAATRREMRKAGPQVVDRRFENGIVISRMSDGTEVRTKALRAVSARIPNAIARLRIDRALARIAATSAEETDQDKVAQRLEHLADRLERDARGGAN